MKRIILLLPLVAVLVGCNHEQSPGLIATTSVAPGVGKPYRRAYPVALPVINYPASAASGAAAVAAMPATSTNAVINSTPASPLSTDSSSSTPSPYSTLPSTESTVATNTEAIAAPTSSEVTATQTLPFVAPTAGLPIPAAPVPPVGPNQVVVLDTSFGRILVQLDDFAAPKTCDNFRKLVRSGFYDATIFHRVIPKFIIQGGDPNTKGTDRARYGQGDPGYTLPPEIKLHHDRGAVAMARLPDAVDPQRYSNGSQFYICVAPCPSLDNQYTVFGHVIAGMDVADRISVQPTDKRADPLERITMKATLEPRDRALRENAATGL